MCISNHSNNSTTGYQPAEMWREGVCMCMLCMYGGGPVLQKYKQKIKTKTLINKRINKRTPDVYMIAKIIQCLIGWNSKYVYNKNNMNNQNS